MAEEKKSTEPAEKGRRKPLLNLDTLIERATVVIDGESHEITSPSELSIIDHHRLGRQGSQLEVLLQKEDASVQELDETKELLDTLCRSVLRAPDEVHEKLTDTHRLQLAQAFTELLMATVRLPGAETVEGGPESQTGGSGSPV